MSTSRGKAASSPPAKEGKTNDEVMLIAILKSFDPADGKISMVEFANAMGYTNVKSACNAFNRLKTKHGLKVDKATTKVTKPVTPKKRGNRRGRAAKEPVEEDSASGDAADAEDDDEAESSEASRALKDESPEFNLEDAA
ncbi:hypothetical protein N7528_001988 [Penicillium herquei]|nr:hypothetical protein N7528_001988 [Penicillium herquei]